MEKQAKTAKGIIAPIADKPSLILSTQSTIVAKSNPNRFGQFYKPEREGSSLRGVKRTTGLAYATVVDLVGYAGSKAQLGHKAQVNQIQTLSVSGDEFWSYVEKNLRGRQ